MTDKDINAPAPCTREPSTEAVARTICLSYGRDPDALTDWLEMCDADNQPVPTWRVYEEQAEAVLAAHHFVAPVQQSAASTVEPVAYRIGHSGGGYHYMDAADARFKDQMEPLYAAPATSPEPDAVRDEEIVRIVSDAMVDVADRDIYGIKFAQTIDQRRAERAKDAILALFVARNDRGGHNVG